MFRMEEISFVVLDPLWKLFQQCNILTSSLVSVVQIDVDRMECMLFAVDYFLPMQLKNSTKPGEQLYLFKRAIRITRDSLDTCSSRVGHRDCIGDSITI
jgi:hypothetical protein